MTIEDVNKVLEGKTKFTDKVHSEDSFTTKGNHTVMYQEMSSGYKQLTFISHDALLQMYKEVFEGEVRKTKQDSKNTNT
jgi:hypothetical protein